MRTEKEYLKVVNLKNIGLNNSEISKIVNIPRTTINSWLKNKPVYKNEFNPKKYIIENNILNEYSYLLGLYLGDGYINKTPRTYRLRIFNDIKYDKLNKHIIKTIKKILPNNSVNVINHDTYYTIYVYSNKIKYLFPQLGDGLKHKRKIILSNWQKEIIKYKYLLMGLYHSDGTYYNRIVNNKNYPAYGFRNESMDIHNIFQKCCDKLKINYTFATKVKNTNIYKRIDVNNLNKLIGTKNKIIWE